jgi:hypothetical protein
VNQNGRKSAAALAVVEHAATLPIPPGLSGGERAVWLRSVNGKPTDYFGSEHVAMLVEYCRLVCRLDVIDQQVREFKPEWLATDEGLKRYDRLVSMGSKLSGAMHILARDMRLTHQSVYRAEKVVSKPAGRLWQRDAK